MPELKAIFLFFALWFSIPVVNNLINKSGVAIGNCVLFGGFWAGFYYVAF